MITYNAGTNIISLDDSSGAGDSWANAYTMEDVLSACGSVVTKQGANAYYISARLMFVEGVYFKSKNEFVELKPNPINPAWVFRVDVGAHVMFGEYNSTDKYSTDGSRWDMYLTNQTGLSANGNRIVGEFLVYGSYIWTDATTGFQKGLMLIAGASVRYYDSKFKYAGYFWAADTDIQNVTWFGGGGNYDMLIAVGPSHNWGGLTTVGCNNGVFFSATTTADVDLYDTTTLGAIRDVYLSGSCPYLIRGINSPTLQTVSSIGAGRPGYQECYTFNVKVTDSTGSPIVGATVELRDVDDTLVFSEDTIVGGVLATDEIVIKKWYRNAAQGGIKTYNDHTLKVSNGTDETEYKVTIDHKITEDVVLLPQSLALYDNIMTELEEVKEFAELAFVTNK